MLLPLKSVAKFWWVSVGANSNVVCSVMNGFTYIRKHGRLQINIKYI